MAKTKEIASIHKKVKAAYDLIDFELIPHKEDEETLKMMHFYSSELLNFAHHLQQQLEKLKAYDELGNT